MTVIDISRPENQLSAAVIDCAFKIHKQYGPGLLESLYEEILCVELSRKSIKFERQKPFSVIHEGVKIDIGFRADLVIDDQIIVELKAIEKLLPIHKAQVMSYMKLSNINLGLLINFNSLLLKDGIQRIVL